MVSDDNHAPAPTEAPYVLIVDDSPGMRAYLRTALTAVRYQCLEAANGISAFDCILRRRIDLVITDLDMPGMNGLQLLAAVGLMDQVSRPPVIVLSARLEVGSVDRMPELRLASALLEKPVDLQALLHSVHSVVA